ncbi:Imm10 family immunity protein [Solwaraspora sp. WMMA2056]|uniref:Imm10 family immunity protein n=1 Tax=Solwaraspora sp. WMMA2056 TaxID=3015161 RepID=UPI00259B2AE0|nr:Imm10 family immunity protein [Solwaraspora sp. WMMA2056]WJK40038.1 Imm10 family immunity protein [Solwaraspora sp. WMMA2056]
MGDDQMNEESIDNIEVVAAAVVELRDVETFCVALATDRHGEKFGLSFQVPLSGRHDDQDRRLEMDTYSISDNLGRTVYGGISSWSSDAAKSVLSLTFSAAVVDALNVRSNLNFHLPPDKFDEIVEGFRRLFAADEWGRRLQAESS